MCSFKRAETMTGEQKCGRDVVCTLGETDKQGQGAPACITQPMTAATHGIAYCLCAIVHSLAFTSYAFRCTTGAPTALPAIWRVSSPPRQIRHEQHL
jgi:hypothetical protein